MENLEQQFSKDLLLTTETSKSVREYSDPIPYDLLIDIFSRVPGNSIARFRFVSKFWRSIIGRPDFTELFLSKSLARPRILFAIEVNKFLIFFSSPQPQNPVENSSLVATPYKKFFLEDFLSHIRPPVSGLFLLRGKDRVCNPITGQFITLPKVKAKGDRELSFFGYDSINKQFKVFSTTWSYNRKPNTHQVLTLGSTRTLIWRSIECNSHYSVKMTNNDGIYINGVLYYIAYFERSSMIVCFDFSSEKFSFINCHEEIRGGTLVNYKGNLGELEEKGYEFVLWVLEDAGKHKWSKTIYARTQSLLWEVIRFGFDIVGMTGAGDIVFSKNVAPKPFYIVYYSLERNTFTRVYIQGFEEFLHRSVFIKTFLDYVENVKLF